MRRTSCSRSARNVVLQTLLSKARPAGLRWLLCLFSRCRFHSAGRPGCATRARLAGRTWKMIRTNFSLALLVLLFVAHQGAPLTAQEALQKQIRDIAKDAQGKVSVACSLAGTALNCDVNALSHPPMQSVFKLPLAVAVLHQVEQGKFSLEQPIRFRKEDLILPKPYSPLQDKYPNADVDVPLNRLLQLTVGLSDNTAADILLRLAGGPSVVREYIASLHVKGFHLEDGERELHRDVQAQYRNWFEPRSE